MQIKEIENQKRPFSADINKSEVVEKRGLSTRVDSKVLKRIERIAKLQKRSIAGQVELIFEEWLKIKGNEILKWYENE